jgi:uncharacterized protein (DUF58 family)
MDTKEIIKRVRKIEIKSKMLVDGLVAGAYHSVFKGRGIEFSEVREYMPGDDVRTIDWNVTARLNSPYVKEFIEERDLTVYIMFDGSASGNFGSTKEKRESATELAASIMFAALRNNDNAGMLLFAGKAERFIPARKGRRHVLQMISELLRFQPVSPGTDIAHALKYMNKLAKRRCIIFILSDFLCDMNFQKELRMLARKHEIIALSIGDQRESDMPDVGYIELEDEETGEQILVNTSDKGFRKRYSEIVARQNGRVKAVMKKHGIGLVNLESGKDFERPLVRHFRERRR